MRGANRAQTGTHSESQRGAVVRTELELTLGSVQIEGDPLSDNLAIALCTYFSTHPERPRTDPDTERGWGEWVEEKCNLAIERIATAAAHATGK
jgi:hypothetical protein